MDSTPLRSLSLDRPRPAEPASDVQAVAGGEPPLKRLAGHLRRICSGDGAQRQGLPGGNHTDEFYEHLAEQMVERCENGRLAGSYRHQPWEGVIVCGDAELWRTFAECLQVAGKPAIHTVELGSGKTAQPDRRAGLQQLLSALDSVETLVLQEFRGDESAVTGSYAEELDATPLLVDAEGRRTSLREIVVGGPLTVPALVRIVQGVTVRVAAGATSAALLNSWSLHLDDEGQVVARPLYGQVHVQLADRKSKDGKKSQTQALHEHLNNAIALPARRPDGSVVPRRVNCEVLALLFIRLEQRRELARAAGDDSGPQGEDDPRAARMRPFASQEGLRAALAGEPLAALLQDLAGMYKAGSVGLFESACFGEAIAGRFERMRPGEARFYLLGTPEHYMGLKLRVKARTDGVREYVVKLYDAYSTGATRKVIETRLADIRAHSLDAWLGIVPRREDRTRPVTPEAYFPSSSDPRFVAMFPAAPAPGEDGAVPDIHVTADSRDTAAFLYALLEEGYDAAIPACIDRIVLAGGGKPLAERLRAEYGCLSGGATAMFNEHTCTSQPAALAAYTRSILSIGDEAFGAAVDASAARRALLTGDGGTSLLRVAIRNCSADSALAFVDAVLGAPPAALAPTNREQLLRFEPRQGDYDAGDVPRLVGLPHEPRRALAAALREQMVAYPAEVQAWARGAVARLDAMPGMAAPASTR